MTFLGLQALTFSQWTTLVLLLLVQTSTGPPFNVNLGQHAGLNHRVNRTKIFGYNIEFYNIIRNKKINTYDPIIEIFLININLYAFQ